MIRIQDSHVFTKCKILTFENYFRFMIHWKLVEPELQGCSSAGSSTSVTSLVNTMLIARTAAARTSAEKHLKPLVGVKSLGWRLCWCSFPLAVCQPVRLSWGINRCSFRYVWSQSKIASVAFEFYCRFVADNIHTRAYPGLLLYLNTLCSRHTLKLVSQAHHTTANVVPWMNSQTQRVRVALQICQHNLGTVCI